MISCVVYIQYQKSRRYRLQFKSLNTSLLWSQYIFLLQASLGKARQNDKKKTHQLIGWQWKVKTLLFANLPWIPKGKYCFFWKGKKIPFPHCTIFASQYRGCLWHIFVRIYDYFNKRTETCIFILFPLVQRMDFHFLYKESQLSMTLIYCSKLT